MCTCTVQQEMHDCICACICMHRYRIAGNFHMVQNFVFFVDRLDAAKIRTAYMQLYYILCDQSINVGVVSMCRRCENQNLNFPRYGT